MNDYLKQENAELALRNLRAAADNLGLLQIADEILTDTPDFLVWSGSSKPTTHHYGQFGLLLHTHEVYINGLAIMNVNQPLYNFSNEDQKEFFLSTLFHDYGKIYDYERKLTATGADEWGPTDHKRKIHHISRSVIFFSEMAKKHGLNDDLTDKVIHNILSHHGRSDWGSPVEPSTRVAWLLHLSDHISARFYDCDKRL